MFGSYLMLSHRLNLGENFVFPFNRSDPDKEWHHVKKFGKAKPVLHPEAFGKENKNPKEVYNLSQRVANSGPRKVVNSMDSASTSLKPTKKFPVRKSELFHSDTTLDQDSDAKKEIEKRLEKVRNAMRKQDLTNSHDSSL